jgi:hypothetical protein
MNTLFIKYIKKVGTFVNQNDMTVYSYSPYLVINVVFGMSEGRILSYCNLTSDLSLRTLQLLSTDRTDLLFLAEDTCS